MNEQSQNVSRPTSSTPTMKQGGGNAGMLTMLLLVIVAVVLGYLWYIQTSFLKFDKSYQAVFLSNGQVYFGQVTKQNKAEVAVGDIYYLQVTRPLQQTQEGQQQANTQGELSLVKLGNELHGPTDRMLINRDHVLFIEDLKDDSSVVQAINNYKSGQ